MPIYEYRCNKCGCQFETLVLSSNEKVQCDACGSEEVDRQMSAFSLSGGGGDPLGSFGAPSGGGCGSSGGFS